MNGTAREGVFEADDEGKAVLALWGWAEEFGLVGAGAEVEGAGDAEDLDVCEVWVAELVND